MAVIAIIGLIAAVAFPVATKYIRRAKTSEALQQLERMSAGARLYYEVANVDSAGNVMVRSFPATSPFAPTTACCTRAGGICVNTGWTTETWRALRFLAPIKHYYNYQFISSGTGTAAQFTAVAVGNLDCDTLSATWHQRGTIDSNSSRPFTEKPFVTTGPNNEIE